jgi:hypothetical protein
MFKHHRPAAVARHAETRPAAWAQALFAASVLFAGVSVWLFATL